MTRSHPITIAAVVLGALALAPAASAADLNPPPPDFYTCKATGAHTICRATVRFHEDPSVTDVACPGFAITDQGDVMQRFTRRYDADGNFVKRIRHETWTNAFWSNPLNGNTVPYTQRTIVVDRATVPGDLDSIVETQTGQSTFTDPVTHGKVMKQAGRTVTAPDGTLLSESGQQWTVDLFVLGDSSVLDGVCAALAR